MLYGILLTFFIILCFLMILIILIQKGKSSAGVGGGFGGGAQALFGGSGGQDIFQKMTWIMGALFMGGSLLLALMKSAQTDKARYLEGVQISRPALPTPAAVQEQRDEPAEQSSSEPQKGDA